MNKHGGYYGESKDVIDFSVNINPLGISKNLEKAIISGISQLHKYPEIDGSTAIKHIAKHYNIKENHITLGNGAIELIYLFARALKPKKVLIVHPTFNEYKRAFKLSSSEIHEYVLDKHDFKLNEDDLINHIKKIKPDVIVLCNPNNPTGTYNEVNKLEKILKVIKEINSIMFVDESFIDFANKESLIDYYRKYPLIILRSMTKFYAVPGLRLGFCIADEQIINKLYQYKEPWSLNYLSLRAVPVLLEDKEYEEVTIDWCNKERDYVYSAIKDIDNIYVYKSHTNFHICKTENISAFQLQEMLLQKGIYIRTCEDFIGLDDKYFRIALKTRLENDKLLNELKKLARSECL
ncbi:threonine-phosphate decarboxylase CobD [Clostridiaceae bacterium M8S5]|nr:threonine-phosphate decarboxylase CobD [Clostridiaceae bacterium M8S5]